MTWEKLKPMFRPETAHMGVMKVDEERCTGCGLCIWNCPFRAWEMGDNRIPQQKQQYACFSCFNCMVACAVDAISIVDTYHVDDGFWRTEPHPLPIKTPQEPFDAQGRLDKWTTVEEVILQRRSARNYKDEPVPESLIRRVLEAGRFAPSAGNCQPWKFIVVTHKALIKEMDEAIFNTLSTLYNTYTSDEMVKGLVSVYESNPNPGAWDPRVVLGGYATHARRDTGQNMCLTAQSLGLGSCWVGFSQVLNMVPSIMEKLGIKEPWRICNSIVLGYPRFKQQGIVAREFRPITWFREGSAPETEE